MDWDHIIQILCPYVRTIPVLYFLVNPYISRLPPDNWEVGRVLLYFLFFLYQLRSLHSIPQEKSYLDFHKWRFFSTQLSTDSPVTTHFTGRLRIFHLEYRCDRGFSDRPLPTFNRQTTLLEWSKGWRTHNKVRHTFIILKVRWGQSYTVKCNEWKKSLD